jgi:hypothetical protein
VTMVSAAEDQTGRLPDLERQFWRDLAVGTATNAVSAKIFTNHVPPNPVKGNVSTG